MHHRLKKVQQIRQLQVCEECSLACMATGRSTMHSVQVTALQSRLAVLHAPLAQAPTTQPRPSFRSARWPSFKYSISVSGSMWCNCKDTSYSEEIMCVTLDGLLRNNEEYITMKTWYRKTSDRNLQHIRACQNRQFPVYFGAFCSLPWRTGHFKHRHHFKQWHSVSNIYSSSISLFVFLLHVVDRLYSLCFKS